MPNNINNTPFTWTDAQWLNTQVTNCIDRSTEAVATAGQALALINSLKGIQRLAKVSGVNLNPTITLTYTSLVNTFSAGSTITDVNGSTAVVLTDNGSNSMTITSIYTATGFVTLSGTITATVSGVTASAVVNTINWGDQAITLTGGNMFIITDIILINASAVPIQASDVEWWGNEGRTGINYAMGDFTIPNGTPIVGAGGGIPGSGPAGGAFSVGSNPAGGGRSPLPLANANQYMSILNGEISYPSLPNGNSPSTCGPVLYFTMGTPEGTALTCDMYVYGYVLN